MQVVDVRTRSYPAIAVQWDGSPDEGRRLVQWIEDESNGRAELLGDATGTYIRLTSPRGNRSRVQPHEWVVIGVDGWPERLTADQVDDLYDVLNVTNADEKAPTFFDLAEEIAAAADPSGEVKGVFPLDLETDADSLSQAIRIAVGAASMCWETPEGAGVFQSEKALDIATQLEHDVIRRLKPVKTDPPSSQFADDEIHHADDGTAWVKADVARNWIEVAQTAETLFREARERALLHCSAAIGAFGRGANVKAAEILQDLRLQAGPIAAPNLQPEAAGNSGPIGDIGHPRYSMPQPEVQSGPAQNDVFDPFAGPVEKEPVLHDLSRRRNLRLMEADLPLFLDLPPGSVVRSASVTADPLAVILQVVHPDFDQVDVDAEAPMWWPDRNAFFQTCFAGNQNGGECVLANGHDALTEGAPGHNPEVMHVDRMGYRWSKLLPADAPQGPPHPPRDPRDRPVG